MKITEYPVHGINYYVAKIIEDGSDSYQVKIYPQDHPAEEEEEADWPPAIIRWILWIFGDPPEEEEPEPEPLISRRFPYSVNWVNAINKLIWEYERPIRYRNELFEWDGRVFEPPKPWSRPARVQSKEEPHIEYEEQEIEVKDQDNSNIIRQKIPRLVGKKPRYMSEMAWQLMQEERKRSRKNTKKAQGGSG